MSDCILCGEDIWLSRSDNDPESPPPETYHHSCQLRNVLGGIGHLIAHPYWCEIHHDPDAGLTYRQSAIMVQCLVNTIGVDACVDREWPPLLGYSDPEGEYPRTDLLDTEGNVVGYMEGSIAHIEAEDP